MPRPCLTLPSSGRLLLALLVGCSEAATPCAGTLCEPEPRDADDAGRHVDVPGPRPGAGPVAPRDAGAHPACTSAPGSALCGTDVDAARPPSDHGDEPSISEDGLECYRLLARDVDGRSKLHVGVALDAYYMWVLAAPWKGTFYGVVVRPIIDNQKVLHHWLLYEDNIPGVPTPPLLQIGAHPTGQLIGGWAPGSDVVDFRATGEDVALELSADTTYTLELHYNSSDPDAVDGSGVEICGHRQKTKHVAGISWLGFDQLGVPATTWRGTCAPISPAPIHITSVWPHMHLTGTHMKATIQRADGRQELLHDEPFDFNYQRAYTKDVTLMPGDTITTECTFSKPAVWGQPTYLEMCYLFTTAYPKGALQGLDVWGTIAHGSSSCLGQ